MLQRSLGLDDRKGESVRECEKGVAARRADERRRRGASNLLAGAANAARPFKFVWLIHPAPTHITSSNVFKQQRINTGQQSQQNG